MTSENTKKIDPREELIKKLSKDLLVIVSNTKVNYKFKNVTELNRGRLEPKRWVSNLPQSRKRKWTSEDKKEAWELLKHKTPNEVYEQMKGRVSCSRIYKWKSRINQGCVLDDDGISDFHVWPELEQMLLDWIAKMKARNNNIQRPDVFATASIWHKHLKKPKGFKLGVRWVIFFLKKYSIKL